MKEFKSTLFTESIRQCAISILEESLVITGNDLEYEIRKALLETKKPKGIYFLISEEGKLLYVGKSENLLERLVSHVNGKGGNSSQYIGLVKEIRVAIFEDGKGKVLSKLERTFITMLKPAFNGGNFTEGSSKQYGYESLYPILRQKSLTELKQKLRDWPSLGEVVS